jgi:hypothetical protein
MKNLRKFGGWRRAMWKWKIQLKIKLFIWLAMEGKILTWDIIQARGREGPGICYLCNQDSETIDHLFLHCPFTQSVWNKVRIMHGYKTNWFGVNLAECIKIWYEDKSAPSTLAALICWNIWNERNKSIFEGISPSHLAVIYKSLAQHLGNEGKKRINSRGVLCYNNKSTF